MSATLSQDESGLTLQTWRDWAAASTVTRMRLTDYYADKADLVSGKAAFNYYYNGGDNTTEYGFVYWDGSRLQPVPNTPDSEAGAHYWHCSKTAWFIYYSMGFKKGVYGDGDLPDVENNDWYLPPHTNEAELKTFGFYKLYKALLELQGEPTVTPDGEDIVLRDLENALYLVATPDEVRFATVDGPDGTEGGPLDPNNIRTWGLPEWLLGN